MGSEIDFHDRRLPSRKRRTAQQPRKGIVAEIHRDSPLHPVIEVRYNRLGQPLMQAVFRQLDKQGGDEEIRIVSAIDPLDSKQDPAGILRS